MANVASFIIACFVSLILGGVIVYAYLNHDGRTRGIGQDIDELGDNIATVEDGLDSISGGLETGAGEVGAIASGLNEPVRAIESVINGLDAGLDDVGRGKAILEGIRKRAGLERD